jgi:hypothetical protein
VTDVNKDLVDRVGRYETNEKNVDENVDGIMVRLIHHQSHPLRALGFGLE